MSKIQINYIKVSDNRLLSFPTLSEQFLAAFMPIRKICLFQDDNSKAETPFESNTVGE